MKKIPRIPLNGVIDLTYRCNNNCRHCWLKIPSESLRKEKELTLDEIKQITDNARSMGCRHWSISGGEPMLRQDFIEIFDYITKRSVSYSLNTNGTMITPGIARLMKRKGNILVVLYGATPEVHDHVTRNPGSFEAAIQGMTYLKEAGAGFAVQLVPMKDNYHQFKEMIQLAESLSPRWRVGASWLFLSACGDIERNKAIRRQRLSPKDVLAIEKPHIPFGQDVGEDNSNKYCSMKGDDHLFASCIVARRDFHIDPFAKMTFCCFIKDPALRYDLRKGSFKECWEQFIPSLADKIRGGKEYLENCGSCEMRKDCKWCPVYAFLEHRRFSARVEYLCAIAKEKRRFKQEWSKNHCRYFQIAKITIQVESDLTITDTTFHPKFKLFQVDGPGDDNIFIRHHFSLPGIDDKSLGREVYRKPPWAIYEKGNSWVYLGVSSLAGNKRIRQVAIFNDDHTRAEIYSNGAKRFYEGGLRSLTLFPTDQILIARVLAKREGCYLHSSGVSIEGKGLLFVGHSEAGKSTIARMLKDDADILCDDRMIVRRTNGRFCIYGTWSHGDVSDVSAKSASLNAIMFLEKAEKNYIKPINDRKEIIKRLLGCLVKPFVTADWWHKEISLVEDIAREIPCYVLYFDKSGEVKNLLKKV